MLSRKSILLVIAFFLFPLTIHSDELSECDKNKNVAKQSIMTYAEQLRTAYCNEDYQYLYSIFFSDDGEVLWGAGKKQMSKHLNGIKNAIKRKINIETHFEIVRILQHPINKCIYGVTFHMSYSYEKVYSGGYLFFLWDFTDENQPQIHVRIWQPDQINGGRIPEDEIFSLDNFDI